VGRHRKIAHTANAAGYPAAPISAPGALTDDPNTVFSDPYTLLGWTESMKGDGQMSGSSKSALAIVMAALTVLEVMMPPTAGARPTCQSTHTTSICQTNGSVSIKARPGTVAPPGNMPHIFWAPGVRRRR